MSGLRSNYVTLQLANHIILYILSTSEKWGTNNEMASMIMIQTLQKSVLHSSTINWTTVASLYWQKPPEAKNRQSKTSIRLIAFYYNLSLSWASARENQSSPTYRKEHDGLQWRAQVDGRHLHHPGPIRRESADGGCRQAGPLWPVHQILLRQKRDYRVQYMLGKGRGRMQLGL